MHNNQFWQRKSKHQLLTLIYTVYSILDKITKNEMNEKLYNKPIYLFFNKYSSDDHPNM